MPPRSRRVRFEERRALIMQKPTFDTYTRACIQVAQTELLPAHQKRLTRGKKTLPSRSNNLGQLLVVADLQIARGQVGTLHLRVVVVQDAQRHNTRLHALQRHGHRLLELRAAGDAL